MVSSKSVLPCGLEHSTHSPPSPTLQTFRRLQESQMPAHLPPRSPGPQCFAECALAVYFAVYVHMCTRAHTHPAEPCGTWPQHASLHALKAGPAAAAGVLHPPHPQ